MELLIGVATRRWKDWQECVSTWNDTADVTRRVYVVSGMDVLPAYQKIYEAATEDVIAFVHDDTKVYERGWDMRVLREFADPKVGMVGFGGAIGHGHPSLYQVPYHLPHLARQNFLSNMRDAEMHGGRFTGERDVAVLDAFAIFVRKSVLDKWGGFPLGQPVGYFMFCENLCCECRRQGFRIRLVGVDCEHLGGRTSTVHQVTEDYEAEHAYFYYTNRDVMPYRVQD